MRSRRTPCRAWLFLLFAGLFLQAPLVAAPQQPLPSQSHITPDVRSRLAEAAQDITLEPWQREFMLEVAQGRPERGAVGPARALPGLALPNTEVTDDDGSWIGFTLPTARYGHTAIYDPVRDRMLVFGGLRADTHRNDVWTLSLAGSPAWSEISPTGTLPSMRTRHTAIYDPVRDRMVVFGGSFGTTYLNDVWALSLAGTPAWSALAPTGTPPVGRSGHTAIYDPVGDQMVVFGGFNGTNRNDLWALSLAGSPAWSALAPTGTPPPARDGHTAIYDPLRDRMVVYGGTGAPNNGVWELSLAGSPAWSALAPTGTPPSGRWVHAAFYDPVRDRMVVFGGANADNVVWVLSLAGTPAWSELAAAGTPPSFRFAHAAIYDPVRDRMVVYGGRDAFTAAALNDLWALSLAGSPAWSAFAPAGSPPSARYGHSAIYDPVRDRMVVFGGIDPVIRNDVWVLSLSSAGSPAWSALAPSGSPPPGRYLHRAIYDPVRDRMLLFGGTDGTSLNFNDVWALSLAGSPAWSALAPTGTPPSARRAPTAIYDPVRDRMLVFGGHDGSARNDVWALSLAGSPAWSALAPTGSPQQRYGHSAIYDPLRDRMVVFGGYTGSALDDVWGLSLAGSPAWSQILAGSLPFPLTYHTAIYDPVRDRMVVFAGWDGGPQPHNDVLALSLAGSPAWSALAPAGSPPSGRYFHAAIYDPLRDRMVAFGGIDALASFDNDLWVLVWGTPVSVSEDVHPVSRRFELALPRPNPWRGETILDFELEEPARVVLDVFDAQGRRVKRIIDDWFTAGRHTSMWRGDNEDGRALGSGVYFIRMQAGGFQATRRTVRGR